MLSEEPEVHQGVYSLRPGAFRIPRSITVRNVGLASEEESITLHVSAALVRQLPPSGTCLRIWSVRRYIVAYEVIE